MFMLKNIREYCLSIQVPLEITCLQTVKDRPGICMFLMYKYLKNMCLS